MHFFSIPSPYCQTPLGGTVVWGEEGESKREKNTEENMKGAFEICALSDEVVQVRCSLFSTNF